LRGPSHNSEHSAKFDPVAFASNISAYSVFSFSIDSPQKSAMPGLQNMKYTAAVIHGRNLRRSEVHMERPPSRLGIFYRKQRTTAIAQASHVKYTSPTLECQSWNLPSHGSEVRLTRRPSMASSRDFHYHAESLSIESAPKTLGIRVLAASFATERTYSLVCRCDLLTRIPCRVCQVSPK
jgi:hypothetical protein